MTAAIKIEDYMVKPNLPEQRGMRIVRVHKEFDYKNKLNPSWHQNIAKKKGTHSVTRDKIKNAILNDKWVPQHHAKSATMEYAGDDKYDQLTGFTAREGSEEANKVNPDKGKTMYIYEVEFFDKEDENGNMQSAAYWRRNWRTKENIVEESDYIKTPEDNDNLIMGAVDCLKLSSHTKSEVVDGIKTYSVANIKNILKNLGVKNPKGADVNKVREALGDVASSLIVNNADTDCDVSDDPLLENSIDVIYKEAFEGIKDPKYDAEIVKSLIKSLGENETLIENNLKKKEQPKISIVSSTKNATKETATKIRNGKTKHIVKLFKEQSMFWRKVHKLEDMGFDIEKAISHVYRGQFSDEQINKLYEVKKEEKE